ncbi:MAG: redoxin family protein [Bacteroidota bacterium]
MKTLIILSLTSILFSIQKIDEPKVKVGDVISFNNQSFLNIDKKATTLENQIKKKGLIVVFSCNTCPFVVGNDDFSGWEKQYNNLFDLASTSEIGFVLVNSNEAKREGDDSFKEMQKHAKKNDYKMPYLLDENSKLANLLGAKTTPHVYFFDASNKLIYTGSIDNSWDSKRESTLAYLENAINEVKSNTKITTESSDPRGCSIKRVKVN